MNFGEQIKKAREEKRLTQEQLAEAMEVTRQAVSKWEANQSRPAAAKLARLGEALDLPPEALEPPASPENDALRKWKAAALGLGALCLVLTVALTVSLVFVARAKKARDMNPNPPLTAIGEPAENPDGSESTASEGDTAYMFPRSLPLAVERVEDIGCQAPTISERVPEGGDVLFSGQFRGPYADGSRLEIRRANPLQENQTTFWEIWAFWMKADGGEEVLGRLSDYNHYVNQDGLEAAYFGNVFGYNGYKVSLTEGAACVTNWYFILTEDGPKLLLQASGRLSPEECDVDGDGEDEVITTHGLPTYLHIYDTSRVTGEGRRYELTPEAYGQTPIEFDASAGFCVRDWEGQIKARYTLTDTGSLLLEGYEND